MSNAIIEKELWLVVPPEATKEELKENLIDLNNLGFTQEVAWGRFLDPSLNRDGYEKDGYKAVIVTVSVLIKE